MTEHTHRYPSHDDTGPVPPYDEHGREHTQVLPPLHDEPRPTPPTDNSGRSRSRTAGLLVGALMLGGVGGVLGAAGFDAANDDPAGAESAASTTTPARTPLTPSTSTDGEAAPAAGSVEDVAADVLPSVVKIDVTGNQGSGSGSGIILSDDGEILTNNHVAEVAAGGGQMVVSFDDGTTAPAEIVGTDPVTDLAVIKASGVSGLTPARIGDSNALGVGEEVVAIGSPFGLEATVTSGIVSSLNRPVRIQDADASTDTTYPAIQTDAAINPGNSGGPLVNMAGEVVGINSSIRSSTSTTGGQGGSIGLGFAIPITQVLPIVEQLRGGETATHARLGVSVSNRPNSEGVVNGAGIESVEPGSAAEAAGLKAGDVVTRVDDLTIASVDALVSTIRGYRPGDEVTLQVTRDGKPMELTATLDSDAGQS